MPSHSKLHSQCTCIGDILDAARARATADLRFPLPGGQNEGA